MIERIATIYGEIAPGQKLDPGVMDVMGRIPRHLFVPPERAARAYDDGPLPIGHGQTISQPFIVAFMTHLLKPGKGHRVLEIGTGSGYQAAVLAELVASVYTIEIVEPLGIEARNRLVRMGYRNIEVRIGDGYKGWPEHAPFDSIMVTCGADEVPPPLVDQLKPGGRMVIPVGAAGAIQQLTLIGKKPDGSSTKKSVIPVQFVPLTRKPD